MVSLLTTFDEVQLEPPAARTAFSAKAADAEVTATAFFVASAPPLGIVTELGPVSVRDYYSYKRLISYRYYVIMFYIMAWSILDNWSGSVVDSIGLSLFTDVSWGD